MYFGNTVAPDIDAFLDNAAESLTGNEVALDTDSYNMGFYNGALEIAQLFCADMGCEIAVENGMHRIYIRRRPKREGH